MTAEERITRLETQQVEVFKRLDRGADVMDELNNKLEEAIKQALTHGKDRCAWSVEIPAVLVQVRSLEDDRLRLWTMGKVLFYLFLGGGVVNVATFVYLMTLFSKMLTEIGGK